MKKILILFMALALCIIPLQTSARANDSRQNDEKAVRNKELLSTFGINLDNNAVYEKNSLSTPDTNDQFVVKIDDSNEIVYISNFKKINNNKELNINMIDNERLKAIVDKTQDYYKLQEGYKLIQSNKIEADYWQLIWQKELKENVFNPYDSIQIVINMNDFSVSSLVKFIMTLDMVEPTITIDEAREKAQSIFVRYNIDYSNTKGSLTTFRPNYYWENNAKKDETDFIRLAYKIEDYDNKLCVYVDAITGENLGGSVSLSVSNSSAGCFGAATLSYAKKNTDLAYTRLGKLGYSNNTKEVAYDTLGESIKTFWAGSHSYGFYVTCHGNYNIIADKKEDDHLWELFPSNVSGNWNFVFLDACKTALNDTWTKAFNITNSSSNRAFLGWKDTVEDNNSYLFAKQFWSKLDGKKTIYNAAVEAANAVPGSGTTPIRFYGDKSYTGKVN